MAVTQFYIVEIQQYNNGEFGHLVHYVFDEDPNKARLKGESKYHEVLAAAAISDTLTHSAIMFGTDAFPALFQSYKHPQPELEPDTPEEPEVTEEP